MSTDKTPAMTYRPPAELRRRLETYARARNLPLGGSITVLITEALDIWEAKQRRSEG